MCANRSLVVHDGEQASVAIEKEVSRQLTAMSSIDVASRIDAIEKWLIESGVGREDAVKKSRQLSSDISGRMQAAAYGALYAALSSTMRQVIVQRIVNTIGQPKP